MGVIGLPQEFLFGSSGVSWTAGSVSLKLLENSVTVRHDMLNKCLDWIDRMNNKYLKTSLSGMNMKKLTIHILSLNSK